MFTCIPATAVLHWGQPIPVLRAAAIALGKTSALLFSTQSTQGRSDQLTCKCPMPPFLQLLLAGTNHRGDCMGIGRSGRERSLMKNIPLCNTSTAPVSSPQQRPTSTAGWAKQKHIQFCNTLQIICFQPAVYVLVPLAT